MSQGRNLEGIPNQYELWQHKFMREKRENRLAKMIDSPYHPYSDTRFTINEKGADDMEEDALSKRLGKKASKASTATNDS
jgi:hypothetical protein